MKDILTVINDYDVEVELAGPSFVGRCPFHEEEAPSFTVYPSSQHFKCYGCGTTGDATDLEGMLEAARGVPD